MWLINLTSCSTLSERSSCVSFLWLFQARETGTRLVLKSLRTQIRSLETRGVVFPDEKSWFHFLFCRYIDLFQVHWRKSILYLVIFVMSWWLNWVKLKGIKWKIHLCKLWSWSRVGIIIKKPPKIFLSLWPRLNVRNLHTSNFSLMMQQHCVWSWESWDSNLSNISRTTKENF